jgi:Lipid A core - O-antigen ligase and related enzymes
MKSALKNIDFWIGFLAIGGPTAILLTIVYFWGYSNSAIIVLSIKIALFLLVFYKVAAHKMLIKKINAVFYLFFLFWLLWGIRVFYDAFFTPFTLKEPTIYYYIFFFFYCFVPFIYGNQKKDHNTLENLLKGIVVGNVLFCFIVLILFYDVILNVHRIGEEDGSISPLMVSYIAAMNIAFFLWRFFIYKMKIYYWIFIVINIPLLGLGASKGAIVALTLSIAIVLFLYKKLNWKVLFLILAVWIVIENSNFFSLDVLNDRITSSIDLNTSDEKETRYYLWQYSIDKFMEQPFTGYYTEIRPGEVLGSFDAYYPHNIILEAFLSVGIVGGVFLIIIILYTFINAIKISKYSVENSWMLSLFIVALYFSMFSGTIYNAIWFWFFVGVINGSSQYINEQKYKSNIISN